MHKYLIHLCYDGGDFYGYQRQRGYPTVQESVEEALGKFLNAPVTLFASGRTDTGVHALAQAAHFETERKLDCARMPYAMQSLLPKSVAVVDCVEVGASFHAQYSAKRKTYVYKIYLTKINDPLRRRYFHECFYNLDVDAMRRACDYIIGTHDFKCFMLSGAGVKTTVRTVYSLSLDVSDGGREIDVTICGNGFLHNMVRCIAGTLIDVGRGKSAPEDVEAIIASRDRSKAGKTLEGGGLYLSEVDYGELPLPKTASETDTQG